MLIFAHYIKNCAMIKENFIKLYENSFKENWDLPCYTDYGEDTTFTYGQVAEEIARRSGSGYAQHHLRRIQQRPFRKDHIGQNPDDEAGQVCRWLRPIRPVSYTHLFDGDKTKPDLRKDPFQIGSSLDVVTPEPAEITNYKACLLYTSSTTFFLRSAQQSN